MSWKENANENSMVYGSLTCMKPPEVWRGWEEQEALNVEEVVKDNYVEKCMTDEAGSI